MEKFLEVFYGKESVDDLLELLFNSTDDCSLVLLSTSMIYKYIKGTIKFSKSHMFDLIMKINKDKFINYLSSFSDSYISNVCFKIENIGYRRMYKLDDYDYIFEYFMYNLYHEYLNSVYASHYSLIYKEINKIKNTIKKDLLILNVDDSFIDLYILFLFKQLNK